VLIDTKPNYSWEGRTAPIQIELDPGADGVSHNSVAIGPPKLHNGYVDTMILQNIFPFNYSWQFESTYLLSNNETVSTVIERSDFSQMFRPYSVIIALGTASHESTSLEKEKKRAGDRAINLANAICRDVNYNNLGMQRVLMLNLGRYNERSDFSLDKFFLNKNDTAQERRIIILGLYGAKAKYMQDIIDQAVTLALKAQALKDKKDGLFYMIDQAYPDKGKTKPIC
jgi:hypothetical protein